jgi:hypothetical protein
LLAQIYLIIIQLNIATRCQYQLDDLFLLLCFLFNGNNSILLILLFSMRFWRMKTYLNNEVRKIKMVFFSRSSFFILYSLQELKRVGAISMTRNRNKQQVLQVFTYHLISKKRAWNLVETVHEIQNIKRNNDSRYVEFTILYIFHDAS